MRKRIICIILSLVTLVGMLPVIGSSLVPEAQAATTSQNNIVARADYLYDATWVCQKTVTGWRGQYTFYAGNTYRMPYGQPVYAGRYIGYGVSVDDYLAAAKNSGSIFYTSKSEYAGKYSTYYATDCSAFVSWCWGISRQTTATIPYYSTYLGMANSTNVYKLQLGDCLNSNSAGHVVLVTGLSYTNGVISQIEITEQTPPQLKRSYYTPSQLAAKYGAYYGIYRYYGTVPAAPASSSSSSSGSSGSTAVTTQYYPKCSASYTTFYSAMESIGVSCDWSLHCRIAAANGISDFTGTAAQNTQLLNLLKAGTLRNPDYTGSTSGSSSYYAKCDSSYTTFYAAMESIGVSVDWELHCKIAAANGITDFSGTAAQNTQLLNLLKAGKLINPTASGSTSSGTSSGSSNGYANGYAGGMAGDGKIYAHGLDLSSWQGSSLNFANIKAAGYNYVILRAGTSKGKDSCFETYYKNAKAAGLDVGAYYYSYATTTSAAQTDANNMISWISGKTFEYPIYFDYEDPSQASLSQTTSKNICLTFMDALANKGYLVGMYTGYYKSTQLPMSTICAKYEFWVANYYDNTYSTLSGSYSSKYGMYQYTDSKYINGAGPYDANVCFKDYPAIVKKYGFNGYSANVGSTTTTESKTPTLPTQPVNLGDRFTATITNFGSGKNLSIYEPSNVIIYTKSGSNAQRWLFVRQSDGSYEILNEKYGKNLSAAGGGSANGTNVQLAADDNSKAQRWFIYNVDGLYVFRPACATNSVLDVYNGGTADSTDVQLWSYNCTDAQKFTVNMTMPTRVVNLGDSFTATITNANADKNISIYEPTRVISYTKSSSSAQKWKFVRQSDGSYEITNVKYGKCLHVDNGTAGTNLKIAADNNSTSQRWFIYDMGAGYYVLRPACSTENVLYVAGSSKADEANIEIWTYNGKKTTLFTINPVAEESSSGSSVESGSTVGNTMTKDNAQTIVASASDGSFNTYTTTIVNNTGAELAENLTFWFTPPSGWPAALYGENQKITFSKGGEVVPYYAHQYVAGYLKTGGWGGSWNSNAEELGYTFTVTAANDPSYAGNSTMTITVSGTAASGSTSGSTSSGSSADWSGSYAWDVTVNYTNGASGSLTFTNPGMDGWDAKYVNQSFTVTPGSNTAALYTFDVSSWIVDNTKTWYQWKVTNPNGYDISYKVTTPLTNGDYNTHGKLTITVTGSGETASGSGGSSTDWSGSYVWDVTVNYTNGASGSLTFTNPGMDGWDAKYVNQSFTVTSGSNTAKFYTFDISSWIVDNSKTWYQWNVTNPNGYKITYTVTTPLTNGDYNTHGKLTVTVSGNG